MVYQEAVMHHLVAQKLKTQTIPSSSKTERSDHRLGMLSARPMQCQSLPSGEQHLGIEGCLLIDQTINVMYI